MNEAQSVRCPVCLDPFDTNNRIPKISPACGHTICKHCLIEVLKMDTPKCPLDKLKYDRDLQTIDAFPTNYLWRDLIEMKGKWGYCASHKKENEMICIRDNTLVCSNCVIFGDHKGHDVKLVSDFEEIVNQKKHQLSAISEKVSKTPSEFKKLFEEEKQNVKSMIANAFQSLYSKITKQELGMLFQLEKVFTEVSTPLDDFNTSTSFDLPFDVEAKLQEFSQIPSNPNLLKLANEDFSHLSKKLDQKVNSLKAKYTKEMSKLSAVFQNTLPDGDLLNDFNIIDPLKQEIQKFQKKKDLQQKQQDPQISDVMIPPVELDIYQEENILKIEDSTTKKSLILEKPDIKEITQVQCKLKLQDEKLESSVVSALIHLSRRLVNIESISLIIDYRGNVSREVAFYGLILGLFSQPERLKNIEISVSNVVLGDLGPLYLFENVLPHIKNLKSFDCTLENAQTTSAILRALTKRNFASFPNLEKFRLNLSGADLEEQDIIRFLAKIPNVYDLLLGFDHTALTDQALNSFSTKILPFLYKVKRLEVGFNGTKLTDSGVSKFLANLPLIARLIVGFCSLPISDSCMQPFIHKKLPSLANLRELKFVLTGTNLSQKMKDKLRCWEI